MMIQFPLENGHKIAVFLNFSDFFVLVVFTLFHTYSVVAYILYLFSLFFTRRKGALRAPFQLAPAPHDQGQGALKIKKNIV